MAETLDAAGFAARIERLRAPVDLDKARAFFRQQREVRRLDAAPGS